nr:MAG TPA: hypothetical protein [Caudoviricetes sp.]
MSMSNRKDLIRMKWRDDDTIRFYRDTPDKRGVSELVINNMGGSIYDNIGKCGQCPHSAVSINMNQTNHKTTETNENR